MSHKEARNPLTIRLAEPVVFLRTAPDAFAGRRHPEVVDAPPAILRGLLTLHLTKPTRISSIEVDLEGKSTIQWPEGNAHRRVVVPEEHKLLSAHTVFFSARSNSTRSASLGPGFRGVDYEDDDRSDASRLGPTRISPNIPSHPPLDPSKDLLAGLLTPSYAARRNSADSYGWQRSSAGPHAVATLSTSRPPTPPASPQYSSESVEMPLSRPLTPTGPRLNDVSHQLRDPRGFRSEEDPGQMLEEYRNALQMETGSVIRPVAFRKLSGWSPQSSEPTLPSPVSSTSRLIPTGDRSAYSESAPSSRSTSRDVEHRKSRPLSSSPCPSPPRSRAASPSTPPGTSRSPRLPHSPNHEYENGSRDHHPRWSLSSMSSVFKDATHKVRHTSPKDTERRRERSPERNGGAPHVDFAVSVDDGEAQWRDKERNKTLGKLTATLGLDEGPSVKGWKEFRKGTYTYPVSFLIPANTPPTIHCDFGAVVYRLKAVVHRPGALTTKLAISTEVILVLSPADDGTEETQSIVVERQWDVQLRYMIALNGRSFPIGTQVPFNLTMVPLDKCKIYRLSVFLEEKTEYFSRSRNSVREQPVKRWELLSIRHTDKSMSPILPLNPEHISLVTPYLDTSSLSSTVDEALSSLMGPGPWVLSHELQIPAQCGHIHFTYKHKSAQISIHHTLKVVFRVERGDDSGEDPKTGKRRLFDIVVQTPITVLSCHCRPEEIALPRYTLFGAVTGVPPMRSCACSGWTAPLVPGTSVVALSGLTPTNSRPSTADGAERMNTSYQLARLLSGQEGVHGEAPPEYAEVLAQKL